MDREILFRGKREDNLEWIEGYYTCFNEEERRIYSGYADTDGVNYYPDCLIVIPKTVGQYTGLTDKNGKKIFEGDVVKVHIETYTRQSNRIGVVKYYNGCFGVADNNSENFKDFLAFNNMSCYVRSVEVIGNIHDNPELLERSE